MAIQLVFVILFFCSTVSGQLSTSFYAKTCPHALHIVKDAVKEAVNTDKRMGASLLRLHFHDCFVNGCDASVLLDETPLMNSEKNAGPNKNSLRGFEVIDNIKTELEKNCSGVVSCADILAIAARDSIVQLRGPSWEVMLGRRDTRVANKSAVNEDIPIPSMGIFQLMHAFQKQGLSLKDLIALSGAHTIGQAHCLFFRTRIYDDSNIDPSFATSVKANCPRNSSNSNLSPFTDALVASYSNDQTAFFNDFAASMVNMGNIKPLTGGIGEIRKNCRKPN